MRLFAYGTDGTVYSEDGGSNWTERSTPVGTRDVAAAADGIRLSPFTSTGFVFGDKFESTTFQYLGNGEYVVTDSTGALIVR